MSNSAADWLVSANQLRRLWSNVLFLVSVRQKWRRCEDGLTDSMTRLKDLRTRLNQPMPESDDELQRAEKSNQVPTDGTAASTFNPPVTLQSQSRSHWLSQT